MGKLFVWEHVLTPNAIVALDNGDAHLRPVVQVMDVRQIGDAQTTQERYRLVFSDGLHLQQAMLASPLNELVKNKQVVKGSLVQILEYISNTVQNRRIIIVLNMVIVAFKAEIIGDPKPLAPAREQQAAVPGSGSLQHQQEFSHAPAATPSRTPAPNNGGFEAVGGGIGQSLITDFLEPQ